MLLRVDPQPLDRRLNRGLGGLALGGLGRGGVRGGVRGALRAVGAQFGDPADHPGVVRGEGAQDPPDRVEGGGLDLGVGR